MANECTPLFVDGDVVTGLTTAAVTGKRFLGISGDRDAFGMIKVAPATAALRAFGVAGYDAGSGATVPVIREGIVPVTAGGSITAGAEVEVGTGGKAVTLATGKAVGYAVGTGSTDADVFVALYC